MNARRLNLALVLVAFGALVATPPPAEAGRGRGRDRTPPTVTCPADVTARATSAEGAVVTFSATATDDTDPYPTIVYSHDPGSTFPIGTTTVTVTATDWKGNSATCTFDVTIDPPTPVEAFAGSYSWPWVVEYWSWHEGNPVVELVTWYEWSITIATDGTISGSGRQTHVWMRFGDAWLSEELVPLPADLTATGVLSGTLSDYAAMEVNGWYSAWYGNYGDDPASWGVQPPEYSLSSGEFSLAGQASLDADGNVVLPPPYGTWSPDGTWVAFTVWYRQ